MLSSILFSLIKLESAMYISAKLREGKKQSALVKDNLYFNVFSSARRSGTPTRSYPQLYTNEAIQ